MATNPSSPTSLQESSDAGGSGISMLDDAHALADHVGVPFVSLYSIIKEAEALKLNSPEKLHGSSQSSRQQSEDAPSVPLQSSAGQVSARIDDLENKQAKIAALKKSEMELELQLKGLRNELAKMNPETLDVSAMLHQNTAVVSGIEDRSSGAGLLECSDPGSLDGVQTQIRKETDPARLVERDNSFAATTAVTAGEGHGEATYDASQLTVMLSGLPGRMCVEVGNACLRQGLRLADAALSGPREVGPRWMKNEIDLVHGSERVTIRVVTADELGAQLKALQEAKSKYGEGLVVVDFTHPSVVNAHAELYATAGVPFIMGTMGGDRDALLKTAESSGVQAFIAPTMCKQAAALELAVVRMAADFPGAFAGYRMDVVESHPSNMADTSMTAKTMVQAFQRLGADTKVDRIQKIRSEEGSMALGIPKHALDSHSFHRFTLTSSDGSARFQMQHEITGFTINAEGTLDAIRFLLSRKMAGDKRHVFCMDDLLAVGQPQYAFSRRR